MSTSLGRFEPAAPDSAVIGILFGIVLLSIVAAPWLVTALIVYLFA